MKHIYLDNAATTKVSDEVIEAMKPYFGEIYGNASSLHYFGQRSKEALDQARSSIAKSLNCTPTEIVFTSGGSESDNLAIRGAIEVHYLSDSEKPHVITSTIEHHAVLHTIQELEKEGKIEASYVAPASNGVISADEVIKAIKKNTILISIMYVNNEIGTVQPIEEISRKLELLTADRKLQTILFHTDAVQAAGHFDLDVKKLGVDLMALTAHKIHGPKGIGILYVKKGVSLKSQVTGGDQEFRLRAGTENLAGIVGLAKALELAQENLKNGGDAKIKVLRDQLEKGLIEVISEVKLNGDEKLRSSNILNLSFKNAEGEAIILNLDFSGLAVSSGSACTARSLEPSHVLTAIGNPPELSHGAIRFSLSRYTTEEEIEKMIAVLPGVIKMLREMSPFG